MTTVQAGARTPQAGSRNKESEAPAHRTKSQGKNGIARG